MEGGHWATPTAASSFADLMTGGIRFVDNNENSDAWDQTNDVQLMHYRVLLVGAGGLGRSLLRKIMFFFPLNDSALFVGTCYPQV
jgi:hypothetical protein